MRCWFIIILFLNMLFGIGVVNAQGLQDILKDAIETYVEKKAEDAGLVAKETEGSDPTGPVQNVDFNFSDASTPVPDVFQALHGSSPRPSSSSTKTAAEKQCFNLIQNKIAWDYSGHKSWSSANINALCKGTTNASQPPNCFSRAMFNGSQWGKKSSHNMTWQLASQLCTGTNNSNQKIDCLKQKISQNQTLNASISACGAGKSVSNFATVATLNTPLNVAQVSPAVLANARAQAEQACYNHIQGKIAWDAAKKAKTWAANNIKKLCKGTTSAKAPGNCFNYVMHNTVAWKKKPSQTMDWRKATDLCEGTKNYGKTARCFRLAIASGMTVTQSIRQCEG